MIFYSSCRRWWAVKAWQSLNKRSQSAHLCEFFILRCLSCFFNGRATKATVSSLSWCRRKRNDRRWWFWRILWTAVKWSMRRAESGRMTSQMKHFTPGLIGTSGPGGSGLKMEAPRVKGAVGSITLRYGCLLCYFKISFSKFKHPNTR